MTRKILIIDDQENIRTVIRNAFAKTYQVLSASDGLAGFELIKKEKPGIVFLDINMSGLSGIEVLGLIKESGLKPVIWMLTGEDGLEVAMKALSLGASGYLTKPFEIKKVREIVTNAFASESDVSKNDKPWTIHD